MADVRINPLNYSTIKCKCGCEVFVQGFILKRIPGLAIGTGAEDQIVDLPVYVCNSCGEILDEYKKMYKLDKEKTEETKSSILTDI